jgi:hypothetical protein
MLTNMLHPPREGNFCDKHGNTLKPVIIQDYNQHMGYVDKSDLMTNTYSISRQTWKWTKNLFFHLLDLTVLKSYIILHSCGSKLSHRDFQLSLIRDLIQEGGRVLGTTRLYHRECQPFPPTGWKPNTFCTGRRKGKGGGVMCSPRKRSRVRQFTHVRNATWHCVSCRVSR